MTLEGMWEKKEGVSPRVTWVVWGKTIQAHDRERSVESKKKEGVSPPVTSKPANQPSKKTPWRRRSCLTLFSRA